MTRFRFGTELYPNVNLRQKSWLVVLLREFANELKADGVITAAVTVLGDVQEVPDIPVEPFDKAAWIDDRLRRLGFYYGTARPGPKNGKDLGRQVFIETLARQAQIVSEYRRHLAPDRSDDLLGIDFAMLFGTAVNKFGATEALREVADDLAQVRDRVQGPMRTIGKQLRRALLSDDHPLLDRTFHRLLVYCDTRLLLDLVEVQLTGPRHDRGPSERLIAQAHVKKLAFIEAIIGLVWADGYIDPMERRLITELVELGRLSGPDLLMLRGQLNGDEETDMDRIATGITDPVNRRFIIEQLLFASLVDGEMDPLEERFIARLAERFGIDDEQLVQLQLATVCYYDAHPELVRGISLPGLLERMRRRTQGRIESLVRDNLGAVVTEVRETGDLMALVLKSAQTKLTDDEQTRVKSQLLDIARTIPALALLAAPGGTVIVPILLKLLPFSLMPSAFTDRVEEF